MIIDVRTPDEFNGGQLADAVNIDYYSPDFRFGIAKSDRNMEFLIYYRTGVCGAAATQIMLDISYSRIHNLTGGIVERINAGYPTVK
jgi:phage shock protein E